MIYRTVFTDINLWASEEFNQYECFINELTTGAYTVTQADIRNMEDDLWTGMTLSKEECQEGNYISKEDVEHFKFLIGLGNYEMLLNGELDLVIVA